MSQILVNRHKHRQITFEEICPEWSIKLSRQDYEGIDRVNACVVSEALGYPKDIDCRDCLKHAWKIANVYREEIPFENIIHSFTKHWNQIHY